MNTYGTAHASLGWIEVRIKKGYGTQDLYRHLRDDQFEGGHLPRFHQFCGEPWWPDGWVVRLMRDDEPFIRWVESCPAVDHTVYYDDSQDAHLFGPYWPWVQRFFEASSGLGSQPRWMTEKLIHCYLNAQGYGPSLEARLFLRMFWHRLTVTIRWHLYLKRRWRKKGPPVR